MLQGKIEDALKLPPLADLTGKVDLIFTSPPFPLTHKKAYGNLTGDEYLEWMGKLAPNLAALLTPKGSLVMEIGNAWEEGLPTMSTLPLETLLEVKRKGKFHVCQQFICNNTARLPGPAQWVTVNRIRLKDSYTHVWWMSRGPEPKADNRRVLKPYSPRMLDLLRRQAYNAGIRPSGHNVSKDGFKKNHGGAIPSNVLEFPHPYSDPSFEQQLLDFHLHPSNVLNIPNTSWDPEFEAYLTTNKLPRHPARMARGLVEFFVKLLTDEGDLVVDPFAGSNTTGAVAECLKRKWLAVELDDKYIRGSIGRFPKGSVKEV